VVSCRRLGSFTEGIIRRLLIRCRTHETADELIKTSHLLNHAGNRTVRSVCINPDLSPTAAKIAFEKRQIRRLKKASSNANSVVGGNAEGAGSNYDGIGATSNHGENIGNTATNSGDTNSRKLPTHSTDKPEAGMKPFQPGTQY